MKSIRDTNTRTHTNMHTHTRTQHTHTHMHPNTKIHTLTHTYTQTQTHNIIFKLDESGDYMIHVVALVSCVARPYTAQGRYHLQYKCPTRIGLVQVAYQTCSLIPSPRQGVNERNMIIAFVYGHTHFIINI